MQDGAIDFRKLLREEKKKARQKQQQQQQQQQNSNPPVTAAGSPSVLLATAAVVAAVVDSSKNTIDGTVRTVIREEDVDAINFNELLKEEQSKAQQHRTATIRTAAEAEAEADVIKWESVLLSLKNVATFDRQRHLLCDDPPSIYYAANFLNDSTTIIIMEWLQSLPMNHQPNSQHAANGCWTKMPYAKRRVALFDKTMSTTTTTTTTTCHNFPAILQCIVDVLVQRQIFTKERPPNHVLINEYDPGQGILAHTDGPAYLSRTATLSLGSDVLIDFTKKIIYSNKPTKTKSSEMTERTTTTTSSASSTTTAAAATRGNNAKGMAEQETDDAADGADDDDDPLTILLQAGSLLVFEDSAYLDYCHCIQDRVLTETIPNNCLNNDNNNNNNNNNMNGRKELTRGYRISLTFRHKYAT